MAEMVRLLPGVLEDSPDWDDGMTKLLDQAMTKMRTLPTDLQDEVARLVLTYVGADDRLADVLTPDEEAEVFESEAQATRGEFTTDAEVRTVWTKHGLESSLDPCGA